MTPPSTTPLEVVTAIYEAFARKDLEAILELTSPDIVVTQDPALPWGGRFEGHDGLGEFVMALLGSIDSAVTVEAIFEADDRVVQYGRTAGTVRASGAVFNIPECHLWRVENGRAVAAQYFIDSAAMLDALGAADQPSAAAPAVAKASAEPSGPMETDVVHTSVSGDW